MVRNTIPDMRVVIAGITCDADQTRVKAALKTKFPVAYREKIVFVFDGHRDEHGRTAISMTGVPATITPWAVELIRGVISDCGYRVPLAIQAAIPCSAT